MIVLIDNYDSFTYNLFQQIESLGYEVQVFKHDQVSIDDIMALRPTHIVISPGPKTPADSGISVDVIREFYKDIPILGVCLGHQCLGEVFGVHTIPARQVMHGKTDAIFHDQVGIFKGLPLLFRAARYHSLMIDNVPEDFVRTAWSEDGTIMAIQHKQYPVFGVQFHPESFMTEHGNDVMRNFLQWQQ